ncbi:DUF7009 family protein [Cyclobacterium jeungdonense]|uniref:Uncharacterized protein n=1 Tax=Cyclobacterium jeungdonense TaxID=708087 RepID=A0ABT8CEP8_9BACT|nr:hypothetical protein [Cyclobacterium jeungdonense]MDN3690537.1 hypothetical protein [Cyclobacterium jeungdonense]
MKLRIHKNAIRLRLSQSEVDQIALGRPIYEELNLGEKQVLQYALIPDQTLDSILARFSDQKLEIFVPLTLSTTWAKTDEVSLNQTQNEGTLQETLILIEKDFQCLHKRPNEDESDNFPNPKTPEDYSKSVN